MIDADRERIQQPGEPVELRAFDPFDPTLQLDPYPLYSALRARAPVHHDGERDTWSVATHELVARALADADGFASSSEAPDLRARSYGMREAQYLAGDSQRHEALVVALRPLIGRPAHARLEVVIEAIVESLVTEAVTEGRCDMAASLARRVPTLVLCEVLGLPRDDERRISDWVDALFHRELHSPTVPASSSEAYFELRGYLEAATKRPRAGLRSLQAAEAAGVITADEVLDILVLLLAAGIKTTSSLIGSMLLLLGSDGEQQDLALSGRVAPVAVVDESLRYDSPAQWVVRQTTRPADLGPTTIPAGALVLLLLGSANRDASRHERPDRFDCARRRRGHLAFGAKLHFCSGAWLARTEAATVVSALGERVRSFVLDGDVIRTLTPAEREIYSLPVVLHAR